MKCTKCTKILLALESPLLRELLHKRIEKEDGVEVEEQGLVDAVDILLAVGRTEADVVIQTWPENGEMPGICSHMFLEYPNLIIVGLPRDSDTAIVCRQTIATTGLSALGLEDLFSAIRHKCGNEVESSNRQEGSTLSIAKESER